MVFRLFVPCLVSSRKLFTVHLMIFNLLLLSCSFIPLKERPSILLLGDSIAASWELGSYMPEEEVVDAGVGGADIAAAIIQFRSNIGSRSFDKIVVLVGTNNTKALIDNGLSDSGIIDAMKILLSGMIKCLDSASLNYWIISLLPVRNNYLRKNGIHLALNAWLHTALLSGRGTLVDAYETLEDENGELCEYCTTDGTHLNSEGYDDLSRLLMTKMK
jgi:GDSL-like Lipase/Acylhydrolase family